MSKTSPIDDKCDLVMMTNSYVGPWNNIYELDYNKAFLFSTAI